MTKCNLDHSFDDVVAKFESQKNVLEINVLSSIDSFLTKVVSQTDLNQLFHLLKKYDLITSEEQQVRNQKILMLINRKK